MKPLCSATEYRKSESKAGPGSYTEKDLVTPMTNNPTTTLYVCLQEEPGSFLNHGPHMWLASGLWDKGLELGKW